MVEDLPGKLEHQITEIADGAVGGLRFARHRLIKLSLPHLQWL